MEKLIDEILERLPGTANDSSDPALDLVSDMVLAGMREECFFVQLIDAAVKRGIAIDVRMLAQLVDEFAAVNRSLQKQIAELQTRKLN